MQKNIRDMILSPLPNSKEGITLDTSVVLGLSGRSREKSDKKLCQDFIKRAIQNKNILCITKKTDQELKIICEKIIFPEKKSDYVLPVKDYLLDSKSLYESIIKGLNSLNNFYPDFLGSEDSIIQKQIDANSFKYGLRYNDATILTQSLEEGVVNIATLDKDWKGIDNLAINIYTTEKRKKRNNNSGQATIKELLKAKLAK